MRTFMMKEGKREAGAQDGLSKGLFETGSWGYVYQKGILQVRENEIPRPKRKDRTFRQPQPEKSIWGKIMAWAQVQEDSGRALCAFPVCQDQQGLDRRQCWDIMESGGGRSWGKSSQKGIQSEHRLQTLPFPGYGIVTIQPMGKMLTLLEQKDGTTCVLDIITLSDIQDSNVDCIKALLSLLFLPLQSFLWVWTTECISHSQGLNLKSLCPV